MMTSGQKNCFTPIVCHISHPRHTLVDLQIGCPWFLSKFIRFFFYQNGSLWSKVVIVSFFFSNGNSDNEVIHQFKMVQWWLQGTWIFFVKERKDSGFSKMNKCTRQKTARRQTWDRREIWRGSTTESWSIYQKEKPSSEDLFQSSWCRTKGLFVWSRRSLTSALSSLKLLCCEIQETFVDGEDGGPFVVRIGIL